MFSGSVLFFKKKTAYEMRISDWSSDVCSSDLDILLPNVACGAMCRIGRRKPDWIPRLAKIVPSTGRVEYTDRSDRVFTSPRKVRFYEMEYGIPREAVAEALHRVKIGRASCRERVGQDV